jgi:succinate dehydrogenase hydrophobic anchor subunit
MAVLQTRPTRSEPRPRSGYDHVWWWTVGTGIALLVLLAVHMVANHFVVDEVGGLRTYHQVLEYISHPLILVTEGLFLVVVTTHAMLGLRSVLLDVDMGPRRRRRVDTGLWVLGSVTIAYGLGLLLTLASRA